MRAIGLAIATATAIAAWTAGVAHAQSAISIDRTRIDLDDTTPSDAVVITNRGTAALRLSVEAFAWRDDAAGAAKLADTTDIVVHPSLVEIAPGASRVVRVGSTAKAAGVEQTFRVIAEELPDRRVAQQAGTIAVRTRVSIPVFVAPRSGAASVTVAIAARTATTATIEVDDAGARHVKLATIRVRAVRGGVDRWSHDIAGWYVLAGESRRFEVPLGTDACGDGDELVADAVGEDGATCWTSAPIACR